MKLIFVFFFICSFCSAQKYPASRKVDSADNYFGHTYPDPYRWIENLESMETKSWFEAQAGITSEKLSNLSLYYPILDDMKEIQRKQGAWYGKIMKTRSGYFYEKELPGEPVKMICFKRGNSSKEEIIFDWKTFDFDYQHDLNSWSVSPDNKTLLLNVVDRGKEMGVIYFMDLQSKKRLKDSIPNAIIINWLCDNTNRFFYYQYGTADVHNMAFEQNIKIMLYDNGRKIELLSQTHHAGMDFVPSDVPAISYFEKGNFMFAEKYSTAKNKELYYAAKSDLLKKNIVWKKFAFRQDKIKQIVCRGNDIFTLCSKGNPNNCLLRQRVSKGIISSPRLIYSAKNEVIESIMPTKDYLLIETVLNGTESKNKKMSFKSGNITAISTNLKNVVQIEPLGEDTNECLANNLSWTAFYNSYFIDLSQDNITKGFFSLPNMIPGSENIVSEEIEVPSFDGVKVPLSIVYDRNKYKKSDTSICYLSGYGAYGISISPHLILDDLPLLSRGVVLAYAHVRGGNEKGEKWHLAGYKSTKQNTWKDFNACAEYLIKNKYTCSMKMAGAGQSAGGIMIGRAVTERPALFRVIVAKVGSMNQFRQEFSPNGPVNIPEFGTVKIREEATALANMDAVQHVKNGISYPAMLITTGFNDQHVPSWSPAKFAAAVQNSSISNLPILLSVNFNGGHFSESADDIAKQEAFILLECGYKGN